MCVCVCSCVCLISHYVKRNCPNMACKLLLLPDFKCLLPYDTLFSLSSSKFSSKCNIV